MKANTNKIMLTAANIIFAFFPWIQIHINTSDHISEHKYQRLQEHQCSPKNTSPKKKSTAIPRGEISDTI